MWSNDFCAGDTANCPTSVYSDDYVFWSKGYCCGRIYMKLRTDSDAVTADVAWNTKDMVCQHRVCIVDQGHIYGNHSGG